MVRSSERATKWVKSERQATPESTIRTCISKSYRLIEHDKAGAWCCRKAPHDD